MINIRLEVEPTGVSNGPWAYMHDAAFEWQGNVGELDRPYSEGIQRIALTFDGNLTTKVKYKLYLDGKFKTKGETKIQVGTVGFAVIRFKFFKDSAP